MLWQGFSNEGSAAVDRAIQNWFRDEHRLLIGERMAEIIKQNLNKLSFDIEGRSADDGLPQTVRANGAELRAAAQKGQTARTSLIFAKILCLPSPKRRIIRA